MAKRFTSYRLSEVCHDLIGQVADALGGNRTAVIEQSVRELAKKHGIKPKSAETSPQKKSEKIPV